MEVQLAEEGVGFAAAPGRKTDDDFLHVTTVSKKTIKPKIHLPPVKMTRRISTSCESPRWRAFLILDKIRVVHLILLGVAVQMRENGWGALEFLGELLAKLIL